jgi:hypothetical protein
MTGVSTPNIARRTRGEGARPSEQSPSTPRCTSRTPAYANPGPARGYERRTPQACAIQPDSIKYQGARLNRMDDLTSRSEVVRRPLLPT